MFKKVNPNKSFKMTVIISERSFLTIMSQKATELLQELLFNEYNCPVKLPFHPIDIDRCL